MKIIGAIKEQAANPFSASISNTKIPAGLPSARMALVAPMLPLPTARMSMPFALAIRKPVGIEPIRYAASAVRM